MPELDLDALAAVAEAATPGPWHFTDSEAVNDVWEGGLVVVNARRDPIANVRDEWYEDDEGEPTPFHDAAHIAAFSPPTVLRLLAAAREAERLRREVAALADEPAHYPGQCCPEGYCVADLHELDAAQRDRFRDILRALIGGER